MFTEIFYEYKSVLTRNFFRLDGGKSKIIRLSGPIKQQFALNNGLDYSQLLTASDYKEKYRSEMIVWSEAKRAQDKGYFIRAAIEMYEG